MLDSFGVICFWPFNIYQWKIPVEEKPIFTFHTVSQPKDDIVCRNPNLKKEKKWPCLRKTWRHCNQVYILYILTMFICFSNHFPIVHHIHLCLVTSHISFIYCIWNPLCQIRPSQRSILYKLRSVQNTRTCYTGQDWFVTPGVPDKSSRGLGSMSRYSAQILICFIAYIFHFLYSSVGLVGNFAGLTVCTVPSAIVHCNQNEAGHQTIKAPSMPCWGAAGPTKQSLAFMSQPCENDRFNWMKSVSMGSFQHKNQVNGESFAYLWVILLYFSSVGSQVVSKIN